MTRFVDELELARRRTTRLHPEVVLEIVGMDDHLLQDAIHDLYWKLIRGGTPRNDPAWMLYAIACEEQAFREAMSFSTIFGQQADSSSEVVDGR